MLSGDFSPDTAGSFAGIDFSLSTAVAAAVSGGSDSTALLVLLHRHLSAHCPDKRLVAVTVDHRLRPESAAEARHVAAFCATLGIAHVTKAWTGSKPATGIAAAARGARYRLLTEAAGEHGAGMILTGHTADDQAETVAMREARGTGRGLAGMAPASLLDGRFWLMRPFLGVRREALRDRLRRDGIGWIDDPSNDNFVNERVRARHALSEPGLVEATVARATAAAAARIDLGRRASDLIGACASLPSPGLIRLDPEFAKATDGPAAIHALRILLSVAGGQQHLPDEARAAALLARLAERPLRATLSRAVIDARRTGIFIHREARGLPPRDQVEAGIWDGRFRIGDGDAAAPAAADTSYDAPQSLTRAAVLAQPDASLGATPVAAPWARLLPSFDLAPARAIARLIGGDLPPYPPYLGHTGS